MVKRILKLLREKYGELTDVISLPVKLALYGFHVGVGLLIPVVYALNSGMGPLTPIAIIAWFAPEIALVVREVIRQLRALPQSEAFETSPERWKAVLDDYVSNCKREQQ